MDTPVYHLEGVVRTRSETENFDGPLDLILSLLSKNKMEIQDIQISLILDQYLAWMDQRKELDLDVASEFVTMAAQLVYIKTRMLLALNNEEPLSEMEELIASLEERKRSENYARVKQLQPELSRRCDLGADLLTRGQLAVQPDKTYRYQHQPEDLYQAMLGLYRRNGEQLPPPEAVFHGIVGREPYPVADKAREVLERLVQSGVTKLRQLFLACRTRSEIVATFLAILELCKSCRISLAGFGKDCTVTCVTAQQEEGEDTDGG